MSDPTCVVVSGGATSSGAQGFDYFEGISAQSAGARELCMHRLEIPPGGTARPHLHENRETAIYVLARTDPSEQESVLLLDGSGERASGDPAPMGSIPPVNDDAREAECPKQTSSCSCT